MKPPNTLAVVRLLPEAILAMPVLPHEGHRTSTSLLIRPSISDKVALVPWAAIAEAVAVTVLIGEPNRCLISGIFRHRSRVEHMVDHDNRHGQLRPVEGMIVRPIGARPARS